MTEIAMGFQDKDGRFVTFRDDVSEDSEWKEVERIAGLASTKGGEFRKSDNGFTVDEYDGFAIEDVDFNENINGDTVLDRLVNFRKRLEAEYV